MVSAAGLETREALGESGLRVQGVNGRWHTEHTGSSTRAYGLLCHPTHEAGRSKAQGQAACSASTEPYMQLVSLSASNKAGSSDSPPLGGWSH